MKVRRHARNVFCKVHSHGWKNIGAFWKCFKCGRRQITRGALLDELLPGLNALFGSASETVWICLRNELKEKST